MRVHAATQTASMASRGAPCEALAESGWTSWCEGAATESRAGFRAPGRGPAIVSVLCRVYVHYHIRISCVRACVCAGGGASLVHVVVCVCV